MRLCSLCVLAVSAVVMQIAVTEAMAQEAPPSQFEAIKGLEPFAGFWEGEAPEEGGGTVFVVCRFIGNRSYFQLQVSTEVEGDRQVLGTLLIGKNHENGQASMWGFWPNQQLQADNVQISENTASWTQGGTDESGQKSSASVVMKVAGDEMTIDITDVKVGENDRPDMHFAYKRSQRRGGRQ